MMVNYAEALQETTTVLKNTMMPALYTVAGEYYIAITGNTFLHNEKAGHP